jgi:hypothetical protein
MILYDIEVPLPVIARRGLSERERQGNLRKQAKDDD